MGGNHPVEKHHEQRTNGVRFNVQTVSELGEELQTKTKINFTPYLEEEGPNIKIEVSSLSGESIIDTARGFFQVVVLAYDRHYPLIIRPDDIWLVLTNGFAKHVEENAEALRHNFVSHSGKKELIVNVDNFLMGKTSPEDWEKQVFPNFSEQIKKHIGEKTHKLLASPFSTSTVTDIAAHEITVMAAMKSYFQYTMRTKCGIPWIELQGTEEDWRSLYQRAEEMCTLMIPEVGKWRWSVLGPVLEEFIKAYSGKVNHGFWQSMCKRVKHGVGSGSYSTISGWVTLLYLQLAEYHKPWEKMNSEDGPGPEKFNPVVSSAPVIWEFYGEKYKLHFHAGFFGVLQDSESLAIQSRIGWIVTHDSPNSNKH
jgi:hypothetical protein